MDFKETLEEVIKTNNQILEYKIYKQIISSIDTIGSRLFIGAHHLHSNVKKKSPALHLSKSGEFTHFQQVGIELEDDEIVLSIEKINEEHYIFTNKHLRRLSIKSRKNWVVRDFPFTHYCYDEQNKRVYASLGQFVYAFDLIVENPSKKDLVSVSQFERMNNNSVANIRSLNINNKLEDKKEESEILIIGTDLGFVRIVLLDKRKRFDLFKKGKRCECVSVHYTNESIIYAFYKQGFIKLYNFKDKRKKSKQPLDLPFEVNEVIPYNEGYIISSRDSIYKVNFNYPNGKLKVNCQKLFYIDHSELKKAAAKDKKEKQLQHTQDKEDEKRSIDSFKFLNFSRKDKPKELITRKLVNTETGIRNLTFIDQNTLVFSTITKEIDYSAIVKINLV